jgi:hypothetical protein
MPRLRQAPRAEGFLVADWADRAWAVKTAEAAPR